MQQQIAAFAIAQELCASRILQGRNFAAIF
jgi:hypothetical protein